MKRGDIVDVYWENIPCERLILENTPQEINMWKFRRQIDGKEVLVSSFSKMVLVEEKQP